MKNRLLLSVIIILSWTGTVSPQDPSDRVLMTIAGEQITSGEFIRMFRKSFSPGDSGELDNYLDQFINFKLKVADAIAEGYDTTESFRTELRGYRNQLAQNYLTDPESKDKLLKQAYQRHITEINAWHILIGCPADASPDDSLKAWKKAIEVRERILQGESFEQVAKSSSDDPSVKDNGGNLGYFTAFQMIMPFEDAAYSLKKGVLSSPVRTPYGFHIIMVSDIRPSKGKVKVAHIMRSIPPGSPENVARTAEDTIYDVYRQLEAGASFAALASKYSDHKESAAMGGELNWFGAGEISSDFAEAALSIGENGEFTKPVRTIYGWHIIKRLDKREPGSFEDSKSFLESRINQSYLNSAGKKSFIEKLKKEYKYRLNQNAYNWFVENTDTLIIKGLSRYNRSSIPRGNIFTFGDQSFTNLKFAQEIEKRGLMVDTRDPAVFISRSIELSLSDLIIKYEDSQLEKKFPDFRYLVKEFHDGILLFEISGNKVWNRAQNDTLGLMNYYEANKNQHLTTPGVKIKIYSCYEDSKYKAMTSALRKYEKYSDTDARLYKKFTVKGDTLIGIKEGTWFRGEDAEIDKLNWEKGMQLTILWKHPSIAVIEDIIDPEPLPFEEVQGEIISAYQDFLEYEWIEQLKLKYSVKVDSVVLDEVRKYLGNE